MTTLTILRAGPLATVQDMGRPGMLAYGVGASGPMDRGAFEACTLTSSGTAASGIEFTRGGLAFTLDDSVPAAFGGGDFRLAIDGAAEPWPGAVLLPAGAAVEVRPGAWGNYGYVRFDRNFDIPPVLGSLATNTVVGLGGVEGRALRAGDRLPLTTAVSTVAAAAGVFPGPVGDELSVRIVWGLHADLFTSKVRHAFLDSAFTVSTRLDRMGVRLADPSGIFAGTPGLTLVSDAVVAGDIQILGDGTPIVLMRDHQPTGGYPRIATIVWDDLDSFAQLRPGGMVRFAPISLRRLQRAP